YTTYLVKKMSADDCPCTSEKVMQFLKEMAEKCGVTDLSDPALADYLTENDALNRIRDEFHYPKSGELPWAFCDEHAIEGVAQLVGAKPEEIALCNGLTVNIHVLLTAFYKPTDTRHKILLESKAFPSDHYAIESQIRLHGRTVEESMVFLNPREGEQCLRTEDILSYIEEHGEEIAIIFLPGVQYYTGQLFDIHSITRTGKEKGCLVGWDMAHAFANVPLQLHYWDVDFACWCSYKYGCTGAGGLAGLFVHERASKISCVIITPEEFHQRGCQLSLRFSVSIDVIYPELVKRGVAVDKRYPDVIRVTPVHLYNNYVDCHRFVTALIEACKVAEASL
ncbi:kynureninase, partial [Teladorsagia circumcincta]